MESRRIMDFLLLIFTCIIPPSLTQDRITVFLWLLIAILKLAIFFFFTARHMPGNILPVPRLLSHAM